MVIMCSESPTNTHQGEKLLKGILERLKTGEGKQQCDITETLVIIHLKMPI